MLANVMFVYRKMFLLLGQGLSINIASEMNNHQF